MKWIAICLNAGLIVMGLYLLIKNGVPKNDTIFFMGMLFAAPISSLAVLFLHNPESWIGLYFKRKRLEEKSKIEKLDSESS